MFETRGKEFVFTLGHSITAATASIPSKYQTIVIDNSEKKGFQSKAQRFQYDSNMVSRINNITCLYNMHIVCSGALHHQLM